AFEAFDLPPGLHIDKGVGPGGVRRKFAQVPISIGVELVPHIGGSEKAPKLDLRCLYPCEVLVAVAFGSNASSARRDVPSVECEVLERVQHGTHAHAYTKSDGVHRVPILAGRLCSGMITSPGG